MNPQSSVANAVARRGYRNGWSNDQFAARQIAKLAEELAELAWFVRQRTKDYDRSPLYRKIAEAGKVGRWEFDNGYWDNVSVNVEAAAAELADVQVVIFCLADALGVDVVQMAVDKAAADIERGVRE